MTKQTYILGALICSSITSIQAATIATAGSDIDVAQTQLPGPFNGGGARAIADYWRSTGIAKPNDIDGDDVLGTDGYRYTRDGGGTDIQSSAPGYATFQLTTTQFDGSANYAQIDNGNLTPGATVANQTSGTFNPQPVVKAEGTFVSFGTITFTSTAVANETVRIGLMVDNLDNTKFNSSDIRLTDLATGTNTDLNIFTGTGEGAFRGNRNPDWYYFDVTNFVSGQQIEFWATSSYGNSTPTTVGSSTPATIGAFSFDSAIVVVPEPSSTLLLGLGALGLLRRRR